jgi:U3 small nucleolar ribonucleoprotein component
MLRLIPAYDDVERKTREMVEPADAKRRLVPDEERKSLSQLYEDEFLQVNIFNGICTLLY